MKAMRFMTVARSIVSLIYRISGWTVNRTIGILLIRFAGANLTEVA